jgi:hypothetical protein
MTYLSDIDLYLVIHRGIVANSRSVNSARTICTITAPFGSDDRFSWLHAFSVFQVLLVSKLPTPKCFQIHHRTDNFDLSTQQRIIRHKASPLLQVAGLFTWLSYILFVNASSNTVSRRYLHMTYMFLNTYQGNNKIFFAALSCKCKMRAVDSQTTFFCVTYCCV